MVEMSRESEDKRELLDSIQSDKETISKWVLLFNFEEFSFFIFK